MVLIHLMAGVGHSFQAEGQVLLHRQVGEQTCLLEYVAQGTAVGGEKQPFVLPGVAVHCQKAAGGMFQPRHAA